MSTDADNLRPRATVEVDCGNCGWAFWVPCDDTRLPDGPFTCDLCAPVKTTGDKAP